MNYKMETPIVVTMCNSNISDTHPNTEKYRKTLENNGWTYKIIGRGTEWTGFDCKLKTYHLELSSMDPEQLVVVSDSRDVFCIAPPKNFRQAFDSFGKSLLVSMELFAGGSNIYYPEKEYFQVTYLGGYFEYHNIDKFANNNLGRKFVNSGLIAGKAKDILHFFQWSIENNFTDDQKALGAYMNAFPEKVAADFDSKVLHTCGSMMNASLNNTYQSKDSPTFRQLLGLESFFLHIPGINISEGQKLLYDTISNLIIDGGFHQKRLIEIYPEYEIDKLKFHELPHFVLK